MICDNESRIPMFMSFITSLSNVFLVLGTHLLFVVDVYGVNTLKYTS